MPANLLLNELRLGDHLGGASFRVGRRPCRPFGFLPVPLPSPGDRFGGLVEDRSAELAPIGHALAVPSPDSPDVGLEQSGKLRLRDRLLDSLGLRGDERVLDAGCGRGLLLVGAARRLTSGHAVGLDLWTKDQSGNSPDAALANARAEGVGGRVTVTSGDVQRLPFRDATFDVVVSNLVLDNIHSEEGWTRAVREIARVLKPGGRVLIADLAHTEQYEAMLREEGWSEVERSGLHFRIFPPVRVVAGSKPTR